MIEIPLSSVIVQNQQPNHESGDQAAGDHQAEEPRLIGLGPLRSASKLFIKQRIRASDVLSLLTGCEVCFSYFFSISISNS